MAHRQQSLAGISKPSGAHTLLPRELKSKCRAPAFSCSTNASVLIIVCYVAGKPSQCGWSLIAALMFSAKGCTQAGNARGHDLQRWACADETYCLSQFLE